MDLQVVHVVVAGEIGGAERMLVDLAAAPLAHVRQAVVVFAPDEGLVRFFQEAGLDVIAGGRIRVHPLAEVWRTVGPTEVRRLTDILTARGARLVHLHTFRSHVLGARAAARVRARVIRTEHSTRVYTDPTCWPFSRWSLRRTARAVAVSRHVLATACRKAPWIASRMRVIPNGVDLTRFVPAAPVDSGGPPRLVMLGRLEPRKGIACALQALALVPGVALDIVGDGAERPALQRLAGRLGVADRVHFVGYVADPRQYLATATAALTSAREEGLGIALLEAMAMARPVIGVPVGGIPEVVEDGVSGWLAAERSPAALAHAMRNALNDSSEVTRRGRAARAVAERRFSAAAMREAYRGLYLEVASAPSPEPAADSG